jgi:phage shock protein A
MGIFDRISSIFKANMNAALSKAEDPEKMLNQTIVDMKEQYAKAKKQVTVAIADEKRLKKKYQEAKKEADSWQNKAKLALQNNREDLAREALSRKSEHQKLANEFKVQWDKQKQSTDALKKALSNLERKISEAERKKNLLVARQKRAEAQKNIHETMSGISDTGAFDTFDRMTEKIDQLEAEAEAAEDIAQLETGESLEDEFEQLGAADVEDDLLAMKKEMGLLPEASETGTEEEKKEE